MSTIRCAAIQTNGNHGPTLCQLDAIWMPRGTSISTSEEVHIALEQTTTCVAALFAVRLDSIGVCSAEEHFSAPYTTRLLDAQVDFISALPGIGDGGAIELRIVAHPEPKARHCGRIDVVVRVRVTEPTISEARARAMSVYRGFYPNLVAIHEAYSWVPVSEEAEYHRLFGIPDVAHFGALFRREAHIQLSAIYPFPRNRTIGFADDPRLPMEIGPETVHVYAPFVSTLSDLQKLYDILLLQPSRTILSIVLRPTTLRESELNYLLEQSGRCEYYIQREHPQALPLRRQVDLLASQLTDNMFSLRDDCFEMTIQLAGCEPMNDSLVEAFGTIITDHASAHDPLNGLVQHALMKGGCDWSLAASEPEMEVSRAQLESLAPPPDQPSAAGRLRHLFSAREANCAFRFPLPRCESFPGLPTRRSITLPPSPLSPTEGLCLGENIHRGVRHPIYMLEDDRRRHTYIVGQTGTGKSSLLRTMILQDIQAGKGVAVLDPHGELVDDLLPSIPPERVKDVYYINPEHQDLSIGINMLEHRDELERDAVINNLLEIFQRLYKTSPESMGPAFEQYFRNATLLEMADPETPPMLDGILRIFSDADYRESRVKKCRDPIANAFWNIANQTSGDFSMANFGQYVANKLSRFLYNGLLRRILLQPITTIDFPGLLNKSGILLVDLCKGRLGETNTAFLAMAIIGQIQRAAFGRTSIHDKSGIRDFYLYIDEFQNVATNSFITILSEARKYRLNAILTNQYLHQIPADIQEAVRGNVGTVIAFRTGCRDAELLRDEFAPSVGRDDLLNLPNFSAYVTTLIHGEASAPFSLRTQIWSAPHNLDCVHKIIHGMTRYSIPSQQANERSMARWDRCGPPSSL